MTEQKETMIKMQKAGLVNLVDLKSKLVFLYI